MSNLLQPLLRYPSIPKTMLSIQHLVGLVGLMMMTTTMTTMMMMMMMMMMTTTTTTSMTTTMMMTKTDLLCLMMK
jgi:hypothetical protein